MSLQFPDNLDIGQFLAHYWQQQPLYLPQSITDFHDPLEPDELAGFACEQNIASRLVIQQAMNNWEVRHGPFTEASFAQLPTDHWTLLVQDLNRHIRELDQLLGRFNFLPDWRIDDVMVSYAEPHGSVGPHVDQYDVFLLQGLGTRRWQISQADNKQLIPDIDLRILAEFTPEQEFLLKPGDMLYLPAGVQHYGVSDEPCMTYSIGFRAPEQLELLGDYIDDCIVNNTVIQQPRYTDHPLTGDEKSGEITLEAIQQIVQQIKQIPVTEETVKHWFGRFITGTNQTTEFIPMSPEGDKSKTAQQYLNQFKTELKQQTTLLRDIESRFAYINDKLGIELFINGANLVVTDQRAELARYLCNHRQYPIAALQKWLTDDTCLAMLCAWWQYDLISFEDDV